ncbi:histidine utilization repressor [uncultured Ferrimonas sp.]|uniref:histidine utilization repressor n=1 Tax=uncultured Ferrimonas sp. TaxID=432640 RepID=UPI002616B806|nr:histidine utilization repressor [uncultured Ferrimonas sp.]
MSLPRFEQIKQHIYQQVEQGLWPQHQAIPSENELAQQFAVSRMTARRAVSELVEQGVLVRTQGKGTFVADLRAQTPMLAIQNIADEIRNRGHRWHCQVLQLQCQAADLAASVALAVEPDAPLFLSLIVHLENDIPVQLERRLVNAHLVPDYLDQDFSQQTSHEYLCQVAPLTAAQHVVAAIGASPSQAAPLQIETGCPCLQIQRRSSSRNGIISQANLIYPGHRYRLGAQLDFNE